MASTSVSTRLTKKEATLATRESSPPFAARRSRPARSLNWATRVVSAGGTIRVTYRLSTERFFAGVSRGGDRDDTIRAIVSALIIGKLLEFYLLLKGVKICIHPDPSN